MSSPEAEEEGESSRTLHPPLQSHDSSSSNSSLTFAPEGFNPPADNSPESIGQAIAAISPPIVDSREPSPMGSPLFPHRSNSDHRPNLESLRRNSAYGSQSSGAGSIGESGEALQDARDELLSRTPPSRDSDETEEELKISPPAVETPEDSYNSVWPTAEAITRAHSFGPEVRHPTAPYDPFRTPSFSPALFPSSSKTARRSESPARRPSPLTTHSDLSGYTLGRRQSISADRPPLMQPSSSTSNIIIVKHQRSLSSSESPKSHQFSPPSSPRRYERPESPAPKRNTRPRRKSLSSPGPSRTPEPPARKSPDGDVPILDTDGLPPPILTELFTPSARPPPLRRALSETSRPPLLSRSSSPGRPQSVEPLDPEVAPVIGDIPLVDEGDLLPPEQDLYVDITFEDEGLNTLERIFLLSKSEFAFHRAYIARVLGDLLYDVDPCESVEYVLPLISSFTLDEDEGVREAFAQDLHRIIWYFYSVCQIAPAGTDARAVGSEWEQAEAEAEAYEEIDGYFDQVEEGKRQQFLRRDDSDQTVTVTSEGIDMVDRPSPEEIRDAPPMPSPEQSLTSGTNSDGSQLSRVALTAFDSEGTTSSSRIEDPEPNPPQEIEEGPVIDRPNLPVDFFTPLLGSLLLNVNTVISESVRTGLIYLIARLKGQDKEEWPIDRWGTIERELRDRQSFGSQTGPHTHENQAMGEVEKEMIEKELLEGIVVGMGALSTELPEDYISLEDSQAVLDSYAASEGRSSQGSMSERAAYKYQLIAEATAGRATSMNLIGALCDFYTGPEAVAWGFVDEVLACQDGEVVVRAEGSVALSMLAKIVPVEYIDRIIPLFDLLANDEVSQVRQSACLSLPAICRRIEDPEDRRSFAIKAIHSLTTHSIEVRCAVLEVLGELIYVFADDSSGPPSELMQVFMDEDERWEDWDTVASFNFPGVALTLGSSRWSDIQPLYHRMNERAGDKPRRTLAASLHELAKILTPEQCAQDLMPVYRTCLICDDNIRELVFEHIDVFLDNLPLSLAWSTYLELALSWKNQTLGGWRAREQLALHIPQFFKIFHSRMGDEILGMLKDALLDPFAAVRDAATKGIPESYEILGDASEVARKFTDGLLDLGRSSSYRQRQTFVRCLREFVKPPPNRKAFEDFFLPFLSNLSKDVVDVRLGLAQTVADLFVVGAFYADKTHAPKAIYDLGRLLGKDESVDVRDTINRVDLDHLESNDSVPYEIKAPEPIKRAITPSDLPPKFIPDPSHSPTRPKSRTESLTSSIRPSVTHKRSNSFRHQIRIDRRPSPEALVERTKMDMRLLTPTTPGGTRSRRLREGDGHYHSTPSPNEPPKGTDPFSVSFGAATPEGSPEVRTKGLESPA